VLNIPFRAPLCDYAQNNIKMLGKKLDKQLLDAGRAIMIPEEKPTHIDT